MNKGGNLIDPEALQVNKIVTLSFDFFVPDKGPVDKVLEGSNFQYNPKIQINIYININFINLNSNLKL